MEANSSEAKNAHLIPLPLTHKPPKRLLFDKRYGWIIDEWKDPSEEAYAGGRGMFCILPIAKSLVNAASQSIDIAIESVSRAIRSPDQFSPHELRANLINQFAKLAPCVQQWKNLNLMNLGKNNRLNDRENSIKSAK